MMPTLTTEQQQQLAAPFPPRLVELKPGATAKDKQSALALAYIDARAYQDRLDQVVGAAGWSVEYRQLGTRALVCRLTVLGIVREDVGESSEQDSNAWTICAAQAFKRACASFGLGRYLYNLPQIWAQYDGRQFRNPTRVVQEMYSRVGLMDKAA